MDSDGLKKLLLEYVHEHGPDGLMEVLEELNNIADTMNTALAQAEQQALSLKVEQLIECNDQTLALQSNEDDTKALFINSSDTSGFTDEHSLSDILAPDAVHTIHLEAPVWDDQVEEHTLALNELAELQAFHGSDPDSTEYSTHTHIGSYTKKKILGKGGMGEVWQVTDPELNRTVALKIMHDKYASDDDANEDFDEEAQINAQLQHPGIVPVYSFERLDSGTRYLTMKEIEGQTLKEVIRSVHLNIRNQKHSPDGWTIRRLVDAFHSICETMAFSHTRGVIHRDLKPANIMLGDYGEVQIVDWGIAKVLPNNNHHLRFGPKQEPVKTRRSMSNKEEPEGMIIGTPAYMSPEQALGHIHRMDHRSDIYSLGVILYEILTGETLHKGSIKEILEQKRAGKLYSKSTDLQSEETVPLPDVTGQWIEDATRDFTGETGPTLDVPTLEEFVIPDVYKGRQLPKELVAICTKAMQQDPKDRHPSAKVLAQEVQDWLDGAQRKEKALAILKQTEEYEEARTILQQESLETWAQADELITSDDLESLEGWEIWLKSQELKDDVEEVQQEIHHLLLAALVNDPDLVDTHKRLVEYEYREYVQAMLEANQKAQRRSARRMVFYMENLPISEQQYWGDRKDKDMASLDLLRKRRGGFVGRRLQLQQIQTSIQDHRIVTLVGTAGVGKTHLVLEALNAWRQQDDNDSIFCDLSTATDALGIAQNIAKALSLTLSSTDPLHQIEQVLQERTNLLMVLDNAEQVTADVADTVIRLIEHVPNLKILITSRVKLGIDRERIIRLKPMSTLEGIELFIKRAQQAFHDFALTEKNRILVGKIVEKLDRLPLAIELAAARVSTLQVHDILDRLSERFSLLQGRLRDSQQQALLGALDWSWGLLSEAGKLAFAQCSMFEGGFNLAAAEAVIDVSYLNNPPYVIDILEALFDDNLLNKERQADGRFRYSMLASMKEYTLEKFAVLQHSYTGLEKARSRHAQHYGQLFTDIKDNFERSQLLTQELDNFLLGVEFGQNEDAFRCCQAAIQHFKTKGPIHRGIDVTGSFLDREGLVEEYRSPILMARISCLRISGNVKQARAEMRKEAAASRTRKTVPIANESNTVTQHNQANQFMEQGRLATSQADYSEAIDKYTAALTIYEQTQHNEGISEAHSAIAEVFQKRTEYDRVLSHLNTALQHIDMTIPTTRGISINRLLAQTHIHMGNVSEALVYLTKALQISQRLENDNEAARCHAIFTEALRRLGQMDDSIDHCQEAIRIYQRTGDKSGEAGAIRNLGGLYYKQRNISLAIETLNKANEIAKSLDDTELHSKISSDLGSMYYTQSKFHQAKQAWSAALKTHIENGSKGGQITAGRNLALVYKEEQQLELAKQYAHKSHQIAKDLNRTHEIGEGLSMLGEIAYEMKEWDAALQQHTQALEFFKKVEHPIKAATEIGFIGLSLYQLGETQAAYEQTTKAIQLVEDRAPWVASIFKRHRAFIYVERGQPEKAIEDIRTALESLQSYTYEYTKTLALQAQILYLCGKSSEAARTLEQAVSSAQTMPEVNRRTLLWSFICDAAQMMDIQINMDSSAPAPSDEDTFIFDSTSDLQQPSTEYIEALGEDHTTLKIKPKSTLRPEPSHSSNTPTPIALSHFAEEVDTEVVDKLSPERAVRLQADTLLERGSIEEADSQFDKALEFYSESKRLYTSIQYWKGVCSVNINMSKIYRITGHPQKALDSIETSVNMVEQYNLQQLRPLVYHSLGSYYIQSQTDLQQAIQHLQKAHQLALESDDTSLLLRCVTDLGDTHYNLGEYETAQQYYDQASGFAHQLNDYTGLTYSNFALGRLYTTIGKLKKARTFFHTGIEFAQNSGDKRKEAGGLAELASNYSHCGEYNKAINHFHKSMAIAEELGDKARLYSCKGNLGLALGNLGQNDEAMALHIEMATYSEEVGNKLLHGIALGNLGDILIKLGRYIEAKEHLQKSVDLCSQAIPVGEIQFKASLALAFMYLGNLEVADDLLSADTSLLKPYQFEHGKYLCKIAMIHHRLGRQETAMEKLTQAISIAEQLEVLPTSGLFLRIKEAQRFLETP